MLNELKLTAKRLGFELRPLSETVKDTVGAVACGASTGGKLAQLRDLNRTTALERLRTAVDKGLLRPQPVVGREEIRHEVAVKGLEWLQETRE